MTKLNEIVNVTVTIPRLDLSPATEKKLATRRMVSNDKANIPFAAPRRWVSPTSEEDQSDVSFFDLIPAEKLMAVARWASSRGFAERLPPWPLRQRTCGTFTRGAAEIQPWEYERYAGIWYCEDIKIKSRVTADDIARGHHLNLIARGYTRIEPAPTLPPKKVESPKERYEPKFPTLAAFLS